VAPRDLTVDLALMTVIFRERESRLEGFPVRYETSAAALLGLAIHWTPASY
jgi:hypothetical protein